MYTTDEILKMLNDGQDPEAIAKTFTDALNDAMKAKKTADEEAEKQKKAAETKLKDAEALADHFNAFVDIYYPTIADNNTGAEIISALDSIAKKSEQLDRIYSMIDKAFAKPEEKKEKTPCGKADCAGDKSKCSCKITKPTNDIFYDDFFKKYDLI